MHPQPLWQHPDFPAFYWNEAVIAPFEKDFREHLDLFRSEIQGPSPSASDLFAEDTLANSLIEGITLDRESVHSSFLNNSLPPKNPEKGAVALSKLALHQPEAPLSHELLFELHRVVLEGGDFPPEALGTYVGDMTIVTRHRIDQEPRVLDRGISSDFVGPAMAVFLDRYNTPTTSQPLAKIIRDHIHFEVLHPFCDGNGRIGRALMQRALSRAFSLPIPLAISRLFHQNRSLYYRQFQAGPSGLDLTETIKTLAPLLIDAITETRHILALTAARTHLAAQSHTLHPRQLKVLQKLIDAELQGGFAGGLSNANYQSIAQTSDRTALRDLKDLVERGFLKKTGERKGTRYWISDHF